MKAHPSTQSGQALMWVLLFIGISMLVFGGAMRWTAQTAALNQRQNEFQRAVAAAEGATERALAHMAHDFQRFGEGVVFANLPDYRQLLPTTADHAYFGAYEFNDGAGTLDRIHVERLLSVAYVPLDSQYSGLSGMASTYRVLANARDVEGYHGVTAAVGQDVQVATIPIFQFAIFYSQDMEILNGPPMVVNGRVHGNADLYFDPNTSLTLESDVTAVGNIINSKHPLDPRSNDPNGTLTFLGEADGGVTSMNLPIGTNNSPAAVYEVLTQPPPTEDPNSAMGKERFYNKCDLVVLVSNSSVTVKTGYLVNNFATTIPAPDWSVFIDTNQSFFNKRELLDVRATQIDIGKLREWSQTNGTFRSVIDRDVNTLYVADYRSDDDPDYQAGVRLVNGETLPATGLTVASPHPLYIQGHYNVSADGVSVTTGSHDTANTLPAAVIGDAINLLSGAWDDANSGLSKNSRVATDTTVNAAILAGNVPSGTQGKYSGGVENFPRFLEKWSGKTLTYNGSIVCMYESMVATAPWGGSDVYSPPNRDWAFDTNFTDATKLPPATPQIRSIIRSQWAVVPPNTQTF